MMQEINVQNMNVELVAQMFKNYQSNVLFHLEGKQALRRLALIFLAYCLRSNRQPQGAIIIVMDAEMN